MRHNQLISHRHYFTNHFSNQEQDADRLTFYFVDEDINDGGGCLASLVGVLLELGAVDVLEGGDCGGVVGNEVDAVGPAPLGTQALVDARVREVGRLLAAEQVRGRREVDHRALGSLIGWFSRISAGIIMLRSFPS